MLAPTTINCSKSLPDGDDHAREYHLREYDALRREVDLVLEALRFNEQYTVISVAAVITWLFAHSSNSMPYAVGWWIPFIVVIVGAMCGITLWSSLMLFTEYLAILEQRFGTEG
jgi:hypothetical protein